MSQSDYLKHKKLATELKFQADFRPILESQKYTQYKEFSIDHTKKANKMVYSDMQESDMRCYFNIARPPTCTTIPCQENMEFRRPVSDVYVKPMPTKLPPISKSILQTPYCQCLDGDCSRQPYLCKRF